MERSPIDWQSHMLRAQRFGTPGVSAADMAVEDLNCLEVDLSYLLSTRDWVSILRLRKIYGEILAADTVSVRSVFGRLSREAIAAARRIHDIDQLAHLLGAQGHNLHRAGLHREALESFEESGQLYESLGREHEALKSYYMTGLCQKALGHIDQAKATLQKVLAQVEEANTWRGSPLQALGWIVRDGGNLAGAERLFRQALKIQRNADDSDILVAGTLADLGEVLGMQGRFDEGIEYLEQSLKVLNGHQGQFQRQVSRTEVKIASLYLRRRRYGEALKLLNSAEDRLIESHYYDTIWKIELMRAAAYGLQLRPCLSLMKLVSAFRLSRQLGNTVGVFVQQAIRRATAVLGTPLLARIARVFH